MSDRKNGDNETTTLKTTVLTASAASNSIENKHSQRNTLLYTAKITKNEIKKTDNKSVSKNSG